MRNLEMLPHGVDTGLFHPGRRSESWRRRVAPGGEPILLFAGRLVWEKDLRTLIETYSLLRSRRPDWRLVLAGDGPARGELEAAMPGAVFLGQVGSADLAEAYASSDIFVFPSTTETFGNVVIEAMASGIPPVCAREGGAAGSVKDGVNGFITAPRDARENVSRIEFLLDWPDIRASMGAHAHAYAGGQGWDAVLGRLFAAYREVIHEYHLRRGPISRKAA